jgi:ATP-binding cassette subfamily B protein
MTLVAVFSSLTGLVPVAEVLVIRGLVDSTVALISGDGDMSLAMLWLSALLLMNLLRDVQWIVSDWINQDIRERISARAEERLLAKAGGLSLAAFERPDLYDQLHRARKALDERLFSSLNALFYAPSLLVTMLGLLIYLARAHPAFPLILVAGSVPFHYATLIVFRKVWILTRAQTQSERILTYLSDLMTKRKAAAEVRLFGLGEHLGQQRQQLSSRLRRERFELAREHFRRAALMNVTDELGYGVVIAGVLVMIRRGSLTVGHLASYLAAAERFRNSMSLMGWVIINTDGDLRYLADLIDYLDISEAELLDALPVTDVHRSAVEPQAVAKRQQSPAIVFSEVSFTYPGSEGMVLDRVDLTIKPGERIALVGQNGAGKTTMAKLLLGLYRPTSGSITIDGVDIKDIEPAQLRRGVAAVFQDYLRFELTARENIGFGDLARIDDRPAIESAAAKSDAAEFVGMLSAQYETTLGRAFDENGQDLSSGQWQRLASARAYFRDASVLVLDEPTAALDAKAEVAVYRQFRDMSVGKSVLLISHRLGSARLADRIVFLDEGRIVEQGSHDELLKAGGRYARMYSIQAEWYR